MSSFVVGRIFRKPILAVSLGSSDSALYSFFHELYHVLAKDYLAPRKLLRFIVIFSTIAALVSLGTSIARFGTTEVDTFLPFILIIPSYILSQWFSELRCDRFAALIVGDSALGDSDVGYAFRGWLLRLFRSYPNLRSRKYYCESPLRFELGPLSAIAVGSFSFAVSFPVIEYMIFYGDISGGSDVFGVIMYVFTFFALVHFVRVNRSLPIRPRHALIYFLWALIVASGIYGASCIIEGGISLEMATQNYFGIVVTNFLVMGLINLAMVRIINGPLLWGEATPIGQIGE